MVFHSSILLNQFRHYWLHNRNFCLGSCSVAVVHHAAYPLLKVVGHGSKNGDQSFNERCERGHAKHTGDIIPAPEAAARRP
jgi:hypothetical protein